MRLKKKCVLAASMMFGITCMVFTARHVYFVLPQQPLQQTTQRPIPCDWTDLEGAPFTANVSDIDVGQTELEQYERYVKLKPKKPGGSSEKYSYKVTWLSKLASDGIFLCIEERLESKPTSGGSTFSVYSEHLAKELCNYRDMFNGTYLVWCPPVAPKGRRDITITLQYVNYGAYAASQVNINRYVWNHLIKLNSKKPLTPIKQPQLTSALGELMNTKNAVIWYQRSERWFVKLANGNHFFPLSTERMCACVRAQLEPTYISGHVTYEIQVRLSYLYLLQTWGKLCELHPRHTISASAAI